MFVRTALRPQPLGQNFGPLFDRIGLLLDVPPVHAADLFSTAGRRQCGDGAVGPQQHTGENAFGSPTRKSA